MTNIIKTLFNQFLYLFCFGYNIWVIGIILYQLIYRIARLIFIF